MVDICKHDYHRNECITCAQEDFDKDLEAIKNEARVEALQMVRRRMEERIKKSGDSSFLLDGLCTGVFIVNDAIKQYGDKS